MIPFYIYYSMFGFQRVGDLIWLAADARTRGFLLGGTSGRTTLNGEGLQHQDGHSLLIATSVPTIRAYDPAFAYEADRDHSGRPAADVPGERGRLLLHQRLQRKLRDARNARRLRGGHPEGHLQAAAATEHARQRRREEDDAARPQLFGSGPLLNEACRAQTILAEQVRHRQRRVERDELQRAVPRRPRLRALEPPASEGKAAAKLPGAGRWKASRARSLLSATMCGSWPIRFAPGCRDPYVTLGTDGFGRSDTRSALRRHFEIDAEHTVYATLIALSEQGQFDKKKLAQAIKELGLDPEKSTRRPPRVDFPALRRSYAVLAARHATGSDGA